MAQAAPRQDRVPARRVLIVDDNPDAASMYALLLRSMGHIVETAANGVQAERLVRHFHPDVAFVDLVLPDIDGCDLARHLVAEFGAAVKVYIITGHPDDPSRQRAREAGCKDYFVKPLAGQVLERLLAPGL